MSCTGLLGGTFNPPHNGHVLLAETARKRFGLGPLRVHVSTDPPHKRVDVPVETRLELTMLAFPSDIVVRDDHPYSIDTVKGFGDDAIFLVGADQFAQFLTWREPDEILEHVRLGVATRHGYPREALDAVLRKLRRPERVELFDMQPVPISSSDIRRRAAEGMALGDLVPQAVGEEIERRGLYRRRAGVS
ncbi:MAG: nicotinate-nicotinamide nucleotide adenylyltransferase [Gaiellaceae bacterium]